MYWNRVVVRCCIHIGVDGEGNNYMYIFWIQLFVYLNDGLFNRQFHCRERLFAHWLESGRVRYSSKVIRWPMFRWYIIPLFPLVKNKVCPCWIILKYFSVRLLKDIGIMNIYSFWLSIGLTINFKNKYPFWCYSFRKPHCVGLSWDTR